MPRTDVATAPDPDTDADAVVLPPHKPAPLRRSHSAASLCSLPTPPPTRKRKRGRAGKTGDTDSEEEIDARSGSEEEAEQTLRRKGAVLLGNKKRKVLQLDVIAAELSGQAAEEAFWTSEGNTLLGPPKDEGSTSKDKGSTAATERERERSASPDRSPSASPPARLLKRNRTGLLSPPKSHRRRSPRTKTLSIPQPVLEGPATPPARRPPRPARGVPLKKPLTLPERDSPNNPFLDSGSSGSVATLDDGPSTSAPAPRKPHIEKPTITYVFRGVRTEFANPLYDPRYPETGGKVPAAATGREEPVHPAKGKVAPRAPEETAGDVPTETRSKVRLADEPARAKPKAAASTTTKLPALKPAAAASTPRPREDPDENPFL
ncbi:hypothetical protein PHLGIDRAFT_38020 [Phlebiopsis gigantea 11061_1 CR5-6]|uniref:Uncharacterized protein n=1 Tax=Phlebiopsis gigantea (strain 11061_1 CR5-6) TaxID=745531 RepID=A0A0C3PB61_PHLG1|nr:hypothetical protein PHLGIDRAFT_38020 [Phlebiopsis gigantea 11061_1 CR5-6]